MITPTWALTLPSPSLSTLCPHGMDTLSALVLHQDITPHHAYHWTSVLQPIYKNLPPHDIICLKAADELIVVILVLGKKVPDDWALVLLSYARAFKKVVDNTMQWLHPCNQTFVVAQSICDKHTLLQEDSPFLEFACCVHNYTKRKYLELEVSDNQAINMYWQQGAGLNLAVCGYLMQRSVMIEF